MDQAFESHTDCALALTGLGRELSTATEELLIGKQSAIAAEQLFHDPHPGEFLLKPKTLKFMSKQDRLALCAAGKALRAAALDPRDRQLGCALFMSVGYIPFRREQAQSICAESQEGADFSMQRFATSAYERINPLLAFACLPNMPAHHISCNFDLQGEYFITYPGTLELYLALQQAVAGLESGRYACALVGGVADQNNFLVQNHFRKTSRAEPLLLPDVSAFFVLEPFAVAVKRDKQPLLLLRSLAITPENKPEPKSEIRLELGPADLPLRLALETSHHRGPYTHTKVLDRWRCQSTWEVL